MGQERLGPSYFTFHGISARPSKQPLMVRTFLKVALKVYMELGTYFVSASLHPGADPVEVCEQVREDDSSGPLFARKTVADCP